MALGENGSKEIMARVKTQLGSAKMDRDILLGAKKVKTVRFKENDWFGLFATNNNGVAGRHAEKEYPETS